MEGYILAYIIRRGYSRSVEGVSAAKDFLDRLRGRLRGEHAGVQRDAGQPQLLLLG